MKIMPTKCSLTSKLLCQMLSRLKFILKRSLKFIWWAIRRPLHDVYIDTPTNPFHSSWEKFCISWRYRLAARGLFFSKNEKQIASFQNRFVGERCFIIGNGPSLNQMDLSPLAKEFTFGVNAIYLNESKMGFLPTFHVVEDTLVAEDRMKELLAYNGSVKFAGNHLKYCLGQGEDFIWLNTMFDYSLYRNFPHFSRNALRCLWVGGTVSYLCMQLAYYMGFKEVYLVGFDHSYEIPKDADLSGKTITSQSGDPNHFDSSYFGKGKRWHDPALWRMEMAYKKARDNFEFDGRKIVNCSATSALTVFEKKPFADVL